MNKIILATNNPDKVGEIRNIWGNISGIELGWRGNYKNLSEAEEDGDTLDENAFKKADYVFKKLNLPAVADDTGLFVDYLKGRPGIQAARYAGPAAIYSDNVKKLLKELKGVPDKKRYAEFRTSVCLVLPEKKPLWTNGVVKGKIIEAKKGVNGFGYDPVFEVAETGKTYAQMTPEEKDTLSHRYKAFKKMGDIIKREVAQLG